VGSEGKGTGVFSGETSGVSLININILKIFKYLCSNINDINE
jgi:hypothetical protein